MSVPLKVLILEDRPADAELALYELRRAGFTPDWLRVETEPDYSAHLEPAPDIILADYSLPQFDALRALDLLQARGLDVPFIIVSANIGEDIAVSAMKRGADDYLLKDRLARLGPAVVHALERKKQRRERQQAEAALRESEERFRATFEQAAVGVALVGLDGQFLQVNQKLCDFLRLSRAELLARTSADITHPDDRQAEHGHRHKLLAGEVQSYSLEKRYLRRDGSYAWANLTRSLARGPSGEPKYFIGVVEDVGERKRIEAERLRLQDEIEHSAREWQMTFDAIESPVLILDGAGRITKLNLAAKELTGGEELIGRTIDGLGPCPIWRMAVELVDSIRETRASDACQARDEASGRTWDLAASLTTGGGGGDQRIILVIREITNMVKLQASLHRSETMSLLGSLVSGVAHEVRNPLFGISSTLDAFEARFGCKEEYRSYTAVLHNEVNRLTDLMKDLLEYGRPHSRQLQLGSVEEVITQAVNACTLLAKRADVRVIGKAGRYLPLVRMDAKRLLQVFLNLLENAIQHLQPGGVVAVEAEEVCRESRRWVVCAVKDTGPGFQVNDLPRLFEPFFTRRRGGTGLGLSIVQKIVEEHGGKISAGNLPEGGAVVSVKFPAAETD